MCSTRSSGTAATPSGQALADAAAEEATRRAEAHDHRYKLRSYGAARRQVMPDVEHRSHKGLNNRAENAHVPLRKRERMMQGFGSPGALQRFVSIFSALRNLFVPPRSKRSALATHIHRLQAMAEWKAVAVVS